MEINMEPGKIELVKQHTPAWVWAILASIPTMIIILLTVLWQIDRVEWSITGLQSRMEAYKLPTHNGVITVAFGKRTNMFTVLPDGRMYLLIPLPVTTESGMIEVVEELHGEGVEKKVKIQK